MTSEARREVWEDAGRREEGEEGSFGAQKIQYHSIMMSNFTSTNDLSFLAAFLGTFLGTFFRYLF